MEYWLMAEEASFSSFSGSTGKMAHRQYPTEHLLRRNIAEALLRTVKTCREQACRLMRKSV